MNATNNKHQDVLEAKRHVEKKKRPNILGTHMYIYIYIYNLSLSLSLSVHIYIYIYILYDVALCSSVSLNGIRRAIPSIFPTRMSMCPVLVCATSPRIHSRVAPLWRQGEPVETLSLNGLSSCLRFRFMGFHCTALHDTALHRITSHHKYMTSPHVALHDLTEILPFPTSSDLVFTLTMTLRITLTFASARVSMYLHVLARTQVHACARLCACLCFNRCSQAQTVIPHRITRRRAAWHFWALVNMCIYIYIYIYMYNTYVCMYIYIYIYIYMHTIVFILK